MIDPSFRVVQALWFILPIVAAGLLQIGAIKRNRLEALARIPLDLRLTVRGRRLFGDNKTLRGAVVMIGATAVLLSVMSLVFGKAYQGLAVARFEIDHPAMWGCLLGAGYVLGELPNSFVKRQLDIPPGALASGLPRFAFWTVDQLDSVAGVFVVLSLVWRPDALFLALVVAISLLIHPLIAALMMALGLKERIG